jgi:hypothetical protein
VSGAVFGIQVEQLFEGLRSFQVVILIVFKCAQRPPAIGPAGPQGQCLAIERGSFVEAVFTAGFCCLRGKSFEILRSWRFGLRSRKGWDKKDRRPEK